MANTHSISFNGSNQYLTQANSIISLTSSFCIEFWVKPNADISSGVWQFMHFENNTTKHALYLKYEYNGGTRRINFQKDRWVIVGANAIGNTTLGTSWHHLAFNHNAASSGALEVFLDGTSLATAGSSDNSGGNSNTSNSVWAGAGKDINGGTPQDYANVKMDDIRIWNTYRTSTQINDNKNKELVGNESNLVAYWKLNNAYTDITSGYTFSAVNSPTFSTDIPFSDTKASKIFMLNQSIHRSNYY